MTNANISYGKITDMIFRLQRFFLFFTHCWEIFKYLFSNISPSRYRV